MRTVTVEERRARLAVRHRLASDASASSVPACADSLVGLHASDPVTVFLSVAARVPTAGVADVEAALYDDRSIVRHHAMRRTLWVMTTDVLRLAHAAATRRVAATETAKLLDQLAASGVASPPTWLRDARDEVTAEIARRGPLTARALGEAVPALRLPLVVGRGTKNAVEVAAHTRLLLVLGFEGVLVRARPTGTWINGQYRWARMADWLPGRLDDLDERRARAAMVARWLASFGPGTTDDLAWWTGLPRAAVLRALTDCMAAEVVLGDGSTGWVAAHDDLPVADPGPWVALLPGLDPTTMGWKDRSWYLAPELAGRLFDRNGNGGPTVWVDGRVVGGWVQRSDGTVAVRLLADVGAEARAAVEAAAHRTESVVGGARFRVRFPAPLQAELLAGG